MQITLDQAESILAILRTTKPFPKLPMMNRPVTVLWAAFDETLRDLRMPLYYKRLRKPKPKPAVYHSAIQRGLALLAAFGMIYGVRQVIVSSERNWVRRISFQPRPEGMNWTAEHAIDPPGLVHRTQTNMAYEVSLEDFLHLAAKLVYAIAGFNAGEMPDATATFSFRYESRTAIVALAVVIREHSPDGVVHRDSLQS